MSGSICLQKELRAVDTHSYPPPIDLMASDNS